MLGGSVTKVFALLFVLACANSVAFADEVSLNNGDRLTGNIVKSDGKTLVLHTDYAGDVSLKWEVVQAIQSHQVLHLELENGKTMTGRGTTSDAKLQVVTNSGRFDTPIAA